VAAAECLTKLPAEHRKFWDGTAGLGGHTLAFEHRLPRMPWASASDADAAMLKLAAERLSRQQRSELRLRKFLQRTVRGQRTARFHILLDLGISSAHFDYFERGFSFRFDQPLDMRMNTAEGRTVAQVLATEDEAELVRIFFEYGDEKLSRRIAREIVSRRKTDPVQTTFQLAEICAKVYPPKYKAKGHAQRHPATRVFQALRIHVNGELTALEEALRQMPRALCAGGRLAIITFHSLEDRMVKRAFRGLSRIEQTDPSGQK
jgi:16S rRNA (cytosine1402-N4)-methyltransferase